MEARDVFILEEIINYCDRTADNIQKFGDDFDRFKDNLTYQEVCAFHAIQIGELVNSLSDKFKDSHPGMPWQDIVGLRNMITHDYGKVDEGVMWETIKEDFPSLRDFCAKQIN